MNVRETIEKSVRARRRGEPFTPEEFKKVGSAATVRRELERLAQNGKIKMVAENVFVKPRTHELLGELAPALPKVVRALTTKRGHLCQMTGAEAANRLGLSSQVPMQPVYLTNGPSRLIHFGNLELELRHMPSRELPAAGSPAGDVIQALKYLGPEVVERTHIERLSKTLAPETKDNLRKLAAQLPPWMRMIVEQF
jgi:hypothetical protein